MRACVRAYVTYVRAAFLPACLTVSPLSCLFARLPVSACACVRVYARI